MKIKVKYAARHVVPSEIIDGLKAQPQDGRLLLSRGAETADGVPCRIWLVLTCDASRDRDVVRRLDSECVRLYGKGFDFVEEVWKSRLRVTSGFWSVIELEKV